jgi:hypothetical protein
VGGAPRVCVGVSDEESAIIFDASLKELVMILCRDYRHIPMDAGG